MLREMSLQDKSRLKEKGIFLISFGSEWKTRKDMSPYWLRDGDIYKSLFVAKRNTCVLMYTSCYLSVKIP